MKVGYRISIVIFLFFCLSFQGFSQKKFKVESLNFEGLKKTKASFLTRIAKVKVGKETDSVVVVNDIERFKRLDGIAFANYKIEYVGDAGYRVTYLLEENFSIIPGVRTGQANDGSFLYRFSAFEFNGLGRNIIFGGFFKREVFNGFGVFLEHPYLFSNKLGLGINYQDDTSQQPIYLNANDIDNSANYAYTRKGPELTLFYELNFKNRFELGSKIFKEEYTLIRDDPENEGLVNVPEPQLNKALFRASHEFVDIDIQYQNQSGFRNFLDLNYFVGGQGVLQTEYIINNTTQFYKLIGSKGNFATQLKFQLSNTVNNTAFVPIIIDNQFNNRGVGNTVDRGISSTTVNTEYRHTLFEKGWFVLQGNVFTDVSSLQRPNVQFLNQFSSDTFRVYSGAGVRFIHKYIFNAVLRFDYGVNVTGTGGNGFVFGIGQYF
ncbi:outer membrane protein assembly factor [Algibacter pectinivorans]|uniref:Surface antigen variable number repeat-containing protein n=1 Tax=Algibacter pectinivorans TaxID=870482 RepID=A0A1I1PUT3_9FLAO|nr:outer membrane protein assembly factor [Algibacter pectinivorans]SFD11368.1 hypothetical protein SAMN04487987_10485 [Algibacter pectinivorans]